MGEKRKKKLRSPMRGIEPRPRRWERRILTTRPHGIPVLVFLVFTYLLRRIHVQLFASPQIWLAAGGTDGLIAIYSTERRKWNGFIFTECFVICSQTKALWDAISLFYSCCLQNIVSPWWSLVCHLTATILLLVMCVAMWFSVMQMHILYTVQKNTFMKKWSGDILYVS